MAHVITAAFAKRPALRKASDARVNPALGLAKLELPLQTTFTLAISNPRVEQLGSDRRETEHAQPPHQLQE